MPRKKYRVIDATALLLRHLPYDPEYLNVTSIDVLGEIKKDPLTKSIVDCYILSKRLLIRKTKKKYLEKAIEISITTGDYKKLSKEDLSIIAISLELKEKGHHVEVITDDYSIQNVLSHIGITVLSYLRKIKETYKWIIICKKCGALYPNDYKEDYCEKCGGEIVRKRIK